MYDLQTVVNPYYTQAVEKNLLILNDYEKISPSF